MYIYIYVLDITHTYIYIYIFLRTHIIHIKHTYIYIYTCNWDDSWYWGFDQWTRGLLWTEVYVQMKGSTFEMPIFGTWTKATALRWLFCIQDTPLKMRWTCFWIRISAKSVLDFLRAQFSRLVLPNRPGWEWKNMISSGGLGFCCVFEEFRCDLGDIYYLKMLDYRPTVFLGCHHDTYVLCIYIYIVHCNIQSCFCFERHLISESSRFSSTMCTETYDGDMALETTSNSSLNVSKCHLYPTFPQVFFCDL